MVDQKNQNYSRKKRKKIYDHYVANKPRLIYTVEKVVEERKKKVTKKAKKKSQQWDFKKEM